jgi:hypothetical protein
MFRRSVGPSFSRLSSSFFFEGPTFHRNAGDYLLVEVLLGLLDLEYEGIAFLTSVDIYQSMRRNIPDDKNISAAPQ